MGINKKIFTRNIIQTVLIGGDVLLVLISLFLANYLRIHFEVSENWQAFHFNSWLNEYLNHYLFGLMIYLFLASREKLYDKQNLLRFRRAPLKLIRLCSYWILAYLFISLVFKFEPPVSRIYVLYSGCVIFITTNTWRWLLHQSFKLLQITETLQQGILLIDWNNQTKSLCKTIEQDPHHPYYIKGYLNHAKLSSNDEPLLDQIPYLGKSSDLNEALKTTRAEIVLLSGIDVGSNQIVRMIEIAGEHHAQFKIISSFFHLFASGLKVQTLSSVPILGIETLPIEEWQNRLLKRGIDIMGAIFGLLISLPIIAVFSALIYIESPGNVFYTQRRIGQYRRVFRIIKLRSMHLNAEINGVGWTKQNDSRVLRVGRLMRRFNIDELPQFWNVLKGEMSLVGPRPERPEIIRKLKKEISLYNTRQWVKPGMSGWAQINGWRGDTDLHERIRHDLYYIENWSLWADLYIMLA
ncbi:MAG: sugar transferase, partial [Verrucomicrobiota bacterium]